MAFLIPKNEMFKIVDEVLLSMDMNDNERMSMGTGFVNYFYSSEVTLKTSSMFKSLYDDRASDYPIHITALGLLDIHVSKSVFGEVVKGLIAFVNPKQPFDVPAEQVYYF